MEARAHDRFHATRVLARSPCRLGRAGFRGHIAFGFLYPRAPGSIYVRSLGVNYTSWLMRKTRVLKVHADQRVERDLHHQIDVELCEDFQGVARAFRSDFSVPQPRDQRMKIP
jgi:hypothetical protein